MTRSSICLIAAAVLISAAAVGDEVQSLRGATPIDAESTEPARVRYRDEEERIARTFEEQPPLAPHAIEKYEITVTDLGDRRLSAPLAREKYVEDPEARARREAAAEQRRLDYKARAERQRRPDKRQRRQIIRFTKQR